jgi:hypothetical protein
MQSCWRAEFRDDWPQEFEIGESIAGSLKEKHRQFDFTQVFGALCSRLIRRVQRKSEEHEAANVIQTAFRSRGRSHAPSEGFSSRE